MPDITTSCTCGFTLEAPERWAGRAVLCPHCGERRVIPQPPVAEPAWKQRRLGRRFGLRRRKTAAVRPGPFPARGSTADQTDGLPDGPPAGPAPVQTRPNLRVAATPLHPALLAAQRKRRRRRILLLVSVVIVLAVAIIGGRMAWKNYRAKMYRGLTRVEIQKRGPVDKVRELYREWAPTRE